MDAGLLCQCGELINFTRVERKVWAAHSGAYVETEWLHGRDGFCGIHRAQPTCQKHRNAEVVDDSCADTPVVAASTSEITESSEKPVLLIVLVIFTTQLGTAGTRIPCYTGYVVNLTIAVDEKVLRKARLRATEQGTSINAVLREELTRYATSTTVDRAADAFLTTARERPGASTTDSVTGKRWSREELHLERHSS